MNSSEPKTGPEGVINEYVDACRNCDVSRLVSLFANNAVMSGYFEGEYYSGSPQIFYDEVRDNPLAPEAAERYKAEITVIEQFSKIANIVLVETGYLGTYNLTNMFHLVLADGSWKIASKIYSD